MQVSARIEDVLRHDRWIAAATLVFIIFASWIFVLAGAGTGMSTLAMTSWDMAVGAPSALGAADANREAWSVAYALTMVMMWWGMMIAMMLPSATPVILLYARIAGGKGNGAVHLFPSTGMFLFGYLAAWGFFSIAAAGLQWLFVRSGLLSPFMMNATSNIFAAIVLCYAGLYQLSPLKRACLKSCQGPLQFLSRNWRSGTGGAFAMGLHHGFFCLGCCLGLMPILFFGGVMNLYWIGGLAIIVFIEKVVFSSPTTSTVTGILLLIAAVVFLTRSVVT